MITPIGHGESNAAIHFAIAMLVVEILMNSHPIPGIADFLIPLMISPNLQLERLRRTWIDLFNAMNRIVLSVVR